MLRQSVIDGSYKFSGYTRFVVYEPKERIIDAPRFKDKIVQIAINNVLKKYINKTFIYDSYACIEKKGTHKCVDRIHYFIKKAKWEYGEDAYIIKIDIEKFFYTINRDILKRILNKKIKCSKTKALLFGIIDSADEIDLLGLPLGNTLSQICANIYMDKLDQYCKRYLGIKYFVRYADDVIIVVESKEKAQETLRKIIDFTEKTIGLKTNVNKTKIFLINQGVNTVGFKIFATHKLLRNDSKKRIKRKAKKLKPLLISGKVSVKKAEQIFNSWLGHAEKGNSKNFIESLISKNDYLYLDDKGKIRIDKSKLHEGDDMKIKETNCPKCGKHLEYWTEGDFIECTGCREVIQVEPCEREGVVATEEVVEVKSIEELPAKESNCESCKFHLHYWSELDGNLYDDGGVCQNENALKPIDYYMKNNSREVGDCPYYEPTDEPNVIIR